MLGISPYLLTDVQLAGACSTDEGKAGDIVGLAGCAAIRDMSCLVQLEQMQELDISGCTSIDAKTVAKVVAENRTLLKLIWGGGLYYDYGKSKYITPEPAILEVDTAEANLSDKGIGAGGAIIISAWITHKDKGALTTLNLSNNNIGQIVMGDGWLFDEDADEYPGYWKEVDGEEIIEKQPPTGSPVGAIAIANAVKDMGALSCANLLKNGIDVDQANALVSILKEHPTLKSLCGNKGDEIELDMRGKMHGAGDAIMLVPEIIENGALSSLNLAENNLCIGELVLPEGWTEDWDDEEEEDEVVYEHTDGRTQEEHPGKPDGIIAIANAIPDMRALTSLDLSSNNLEAGGAKIVAAAIKVTK
jgi:hypothetical protein